MLNKEEIENSFIRIETICKKEVCLFNQPIIEGNLNQIKRYIIQLESDKQKLIEKLEKKIRYYEENDEILATSNDNYSDGTVIKKFIDEFREILSILKGE